MDKCKSYCKKHKMFKIMDGIITGLVDQKFLKCSYSCLLNKYIKLNKKITCLSCRFCFAQNIYCFLGFVFKYALAVVVLAVVVSVSLGGFSRIIILSFSAHA